MTIKEFFSLNQNKYFWLNILGMVLAVWGLAWGVLKGIDVYTHHGEAIEVPDVKGLSYEEAEQVFARQELEAVISDSTYLKDRPAGCVLDYHPGAGQKVKKGRTIYLTINTLNVPLQVVPDVADNSSLRQAEARLLGAEFKLAEIQYVAGERDWVYGVKYKGQELPIGAKVPRGATLTLLVGDGNGEVAEGDSLEIGSTTLPEGETDNKSESQAEEKTAADESWF